ncbi:hypothetical protein ACWNT8_15505 (plasmid) [Pigmentibacter ruber]
MKKILKLLLTLNIISCSFSNKNIYTLYRNSPVGIDMRIHVATFDSKEKPDDYNFKMCNLGQELFQNHTIAGKNVKYWCEKGRYKK